MLVALAAFALNECTIVLPNIQKVEQDRTAVFMMQIRNDKFFVPGLSYIEEFVNPVEQNALVASIDQQTWLTDLKRRVQHYGYRYDYKARAVHDMARLGVLPDWLMRLAVRLRDDEHIVEIPDQAIINEYTPGQGIARHVDCVPCFGDTILSISLNSTCVMTFTRMLDPIEVPILLTLLTPGSLTIMQGESRYQWKHGIAARKTDHYSGTAMVRERRLSITFRKVIPTAEW